jgi:hypothetical protein
MLMLARTGPSSLPAAARCSRCVRGARARLARGKALAANAAADDEDSALRSGARPAPPAYAQLHVRNCMLVGCLGYLAARQARGEREKKNMQQTTPLSRETARSSRRFAAHEAQKKCILTRIPVVRRVHCVCLHAAGFGLCRPSPENCHARKMGTAIAAGAFARRIVHSSLIPLRDRAKL